jgi:hypothetical protein
MVNTETRISKRWPRRRLLWLALGIVCLPAAVFAGILLTRGLIGYFHQQLDKQSQQAGVASMFIAGGALLAALITMVLAWIQLSRGAPSGLKERMGVSRLVPPRPAMDSLAAPEGLLEEHVRGRDQLIGELARPYTQPARADASPQTHASSSWGEAPLYPRSGRRDCRMCVRSGAASGAD